MSSLSVNLSLAKLSDIMMTSHLLCLLSVVEENSFPPPSPPPPPPPSDDDGFPPLPDDGSELSALHPPPPPPPGQEVDGTCLSIRLSVCLWLHFLGFFFSVVFLSVCSSVVFFFSDPPVPEESPPSLAPHHSLCLSESPLWPRLPLPQHALSLPSCCPIM